ncbi:ferredoxin-NADP reductase [Nocardioides sp. BE266]|uniref:FAD-binding oxidoreductase n=1 Tax=Nocardioides sp. BE266 TaxID=2817725 RepID=UPI002862C8FC|nr:FAD-binding oxidoreductase [Nocardioides sp. BE266]MDR7255035.1 ferredoxin-NADP reductase [Nocardioides sp. BE266]
MTEVDTSASSSDDYDAVSSEPTPPASRNRWRKATLVGLHKQSWHSRTLALRVPDWPGHLPGQHVDVRLTAADGYSAQRSYSLAEAASPNRVAITVDLLPHGEVSPYLVEIMEIGDELDVRGPIGGWFVWEPGDPAIGEGPVLLIAGGSGVVPLVTMLRARQRAGDLTPTMLVYSLRGPRDLMYERELREMSTARSASDAASDAGSDPTAARAAEAVDVRLVYTRKVPEGHARPASHLDIADLEAPPTWPEALAARVYVCGSSGFVDHATALLREAGYPDDRIRTERFGATGADR